MDTKVIINGETTTFIKLPDAEEYILSAIRQWNNFTPEQSLSIEISKTDPSADTLNVNVKETIKTSDLFGNR